MLRRSAGNALAGHRTTQYGVDKFKKLVKKARRDGIAVDMEEYIEGIRAFAMPIYTSRANTQIALWAVGLKGQITQDTIPALTDYLKTIRNKIEQRLAPGENDCPVFAERSCIENGATEKPDTVNRVVVMDQ